MFGRSGPIAQASRLYARLRLTLNIPTVQALSVNVSVSADEEEQYKR